MEELKDEAFVDEVWAGGGEMREERSFSSTEQTGRRR